MKKLIPVLLLLILSTSAALSQQRQPLRPGQPALEDMVEGFYVSQFQQQVEVADEQYVKILPVLRQQLKERREISGRRTRALNQLRMLVQIASQLARRGMLPARQRRHPTCRCYGVRRLLRAVPPPGAFLSNVPTSLISASISSTV